MQRPNPYKERRVEPYRIRVSRKLRCDLFINRIKPRGGVTGVLVEEDIGHTGEYLPTHLHRNDRVLKGNSGLINDRLNLRELLIKASIESRQVLIFSNQRERWKLVFESTAGEEWV